MRFVLFYHSLVSDWNHGNAHFLRGITKELQARGHEVMLYEPRDGWSRQNLIQEQGAAALDEFSRVYPELRSRFYQLDQLDLDEVLAGADVVIVHEWSDHDLVRQIGRHRASGGSYRLLFHDTHHRCVTAPEAIAAYDLTHYDGVLAYGRVIRDLYLEKGWAARAWTWHEAADPHVFRPHPNKEREGDLVWIGNWGDEERTLDLQEFLLEPVRRLKLRAAAYGVRYPSEGRQALAAAGIDYRGWLANFHVPAVFACFRVTVHITRRPYRERLPGIPTIRPFEALACGIPLITAPWEDAENLFTPGADFLVAQNGAEMQQHLLAVLHDEGLAQQLAEDGRKTILARHTCAHRVDELLAICQELGIDTGTMQSSTLLPN